MKKILAVVNGVALISTIFINYLSNTGLLNGNTMKTISDKYSNYFTPAGYAFSIWGLIYLGLLAFVFYTGKSLFTKKEPHPALGAIGWWFLISCIANSLWVVAWLYDFTAFSVFLMVVILIALLKIVVKLDISLLKEKAKDYALIVLPFTLYVGWISVAIIPNIAALLTKLNWSGWGVSSITWTIIMICVAGLVNIYMVTQRNMRGYGLVGIWALLAIASNQSFAEKLIVYVCYSVCIAIFLSIVINFVKPKQHKRSTVANI